MPFQPYFHSSDYLTAIILIYQIYQIFISVSQQSNSTLSVKEIFEFVSKLIKNLNFESREVFISNFIQHPVYCYAQNIDVILNFVFFLSCSSSY